MFLHVQSGILWDCRCFHNCELINDMVAVAQVSRGYFLWLSILTRIQNAGVEIMDLFSLCVCADPGAAKKDCEAKRDSNEGEASKQ